MTAGRRSGRARKTGARRSSPLEALRLPALAECLKGYLHQDFVAEYRSARAALAAFAREASADERAAVRAELARLVDAAQGRPVAELRAFVTGRLGSGWEPQSIRDLQEAFSPLTGSSAR